MDQSTTCGDDLPTMPSPLACSARLYCYVPGERNETGFKNGLVPCTKRIADTQDAADTASYVSLKNIPMLRLLFYLGDKDLLFIHLSKKP